MMSEKTSSTINGIVSKTISDKDMLFKYSIKFIKVQLSNDISVQHICDRILSIFCKNRVDISDMRIFDPNSALSYSINETLPIIDLKVISFIRFTDSLVNEILHFPKDSTINYESVWIGNEDYKAKKLFIRMYLHKKVGRGIQYKVLPLTKFIKGKYYDFEKARSYGWENYINSGSIDFKETDVVERAYKLTKRKIVRIKIIDKKSNSIWDLGAGWNRI